MAKLGAMASLYTKYCSGKDKVAHFVTIYIQESNQATSLGGLMDNAKPIASYHRTIDDRAAAANKMVADLNFPGDVVCDCMENDVMDKYTAHPERILIVLNGRIVHIGGKGPLVYYDIDDIGKWLGEHTAGGKMRPEEAEPACAS